jgi:hypothetical protein
MFAQNLLTRNLKLHLKKLIGTFFAIICQRNALSLEHHQYWNSPNKWTAVQQGKYQYVSSEDPYSVNQYLYEGTAILNKL